MRKADNLIIILCRCREIWEPELPGTLWANPPSSAAVIEEYSYTSTHPLGHTGPVTV